MPNFRTICHDVFAFRDDGKCDMPANQVGHIPPLTTTIFAR
jgi:hypothetical protein